MGNLCCQHTGCACRRHPALQSNAVNVQGVLGKGTLGYKVMLMIYMVYLVKAPGLQSNAANMQGVLGEGTLVSWFGVSLVIVTRMDMLMCFRAIILLEIPRVHVSR